MTPATQNPIEEERVLAPAVSVALPACNCPDDCERDHEND
jgi:hypothetical protein